MSLVVYLGTALLLGIRHALDPDHLVAVSTVVAEERRLWPAARLGLFWGAGHLLPITLLGLPVIWLGLQLPARLETVVDLGVGFLLVALGLVTMVRWNRERLHMHVHSHNGQPHLHFHRHGPSAAKRHDHAPAAHWRRGLLSFLVGTVHGLAGTGAATVLAVAAASTPSLSLGYLLVFGLGTCLGMFLVTLCVAAPALATFSRMGSWHGAMRVVSGVASIALGMLMSGERLALLLIH